MKIIILSQAYYPDTVSVSQHLTDLAESLVENGHEVRVITSVFGYDSHERFEKKEIHNGVIIERFYHTNFGKRSFLFRAVNFLTFNLFLFFRTVRLRSKYDLVIGLTFPPFSALVGVLIAKIKKVPYYYWVMDLQPELAIASGLIKKDSLSDKFFSIIGNFIIRNSDHIISLDRFMTSHLISRGANQGKISELPVWPVSQDIYEGDRLTNPFRIQNKFEDRLVVMFSGNHAYVHPLDTLLNASDVLKSDPRFLFAFVGGGVRKKDVSDFKKLNSLENISQHPFQPRSNFHISIGASDLQVVVMGQGQVGFTHPNKIYGAMILGRPILYIGPLQSHVTDILVHLEGNIVVEHGDVDGLVDKLTEFANLSPQIRYQIGEKNKSFAFKNFSAQSLRQSVVSCIEKSVH